MNGQTIPGGYPHPLYGPELRVDRAKAHIGELHDTLQEWANRHNESVEFELDPEDGALRMVQTSELPWELLGTASVIVGDVLHNLRASLDYLVYVFAVTANNAKHVKWTQFPIVDEPEDFAELAPRYLKKVPANVVESICNLQPFNGCEWTRLLRDLSNPDKHQHLSDLTSRGQFVQRGEPTITEVDGESTGNVEGRFEVEVLFRDTKLDVADTLELLEREVRAALTGFKVFLVPSKSDLV